VPEGRAGILELEHRWRLRLAEIEVALVPPFVVGELVVRREEGMRLAVALDLRDLVEALAVRPRLGVLPVDGLAREGLDEGEHATVREVAVVGDGEHLPAGLLLVRAHPLPQITWVVAAQ